MQHNLVTLLMIQQRAERENNLFIQHYSSDLVDQMNYDEFMSWKLEKIRLWNVLVDATRDYNQAKRHFGDIE